MSMFYEKNLPDGVNLSGFLNSEKGLGEGARSMGRAMKAAQIPYVLNDFVDRGSKNAEAGSLEFSSVNPYNVNLVCVHADAFFPFLKSRGADYFKDKINIGHWAWELEEFPVLWHSHFSYFDEIWAPSRFTLDALSRVSPIPVVRIPYCLSEDFFKEPPEKNQGRERFGFSSSDFIFLFAFDLASVFERKNPIGLLRAFRKAFPPGRKKKALLVLKILRADNFPRQFQEIEREAQGLNIKIITEVLSREDLISLMACADGYISLHRSEGFGLTMLEAMALGKPVVATGYSGNLDFMNPANSLLVGYRFSTIEKESWPYFKGASWAEPDLEQAAHWMRLLARRPLWAREIGLRARADVLKLYSPQAVGRLISERLSRLKAERSPREKLRQNAAVKKAQLKNLWRRLENKLKRLKRPLRNK